MILSFVFVSRSLITRAGGLELEGAEPGEILFPFERFCGGHIYIERELVSVDVFFVNGILGMVAKARVTSGRGMEEGQRSRDHNNMMITNRRSPRALLPVVETR